MAWNSLDTGLLAGAEFSLAADMNSTKKALKKPGVEEGNPVLGKKPSGAKLDGYGLATGLGIAGAAGAMPAEWRRPFLAGVIGTESSLASQNSNASARGKSGKDKIKQGLTVGGSLAVLTALLQKVPEDKLKITAEEREHGGVIKFAYKF